MRCAKCRTFSDRYFESTFHGEDDSVLASHRNNRSEGAPHAARNLNAIRSPSARRHIEKLERLGAHLGGKVEIYAKREDCNSGLAFGGNKLRKLEYIVPDAIASSADTLVSIGGVQSNHTRMVAASRPRSA